MLQPEGNDRVLDAIAFNQVEALPEPLPDKLRIAYKLDANEFRGNVSLQLRIEYMEPL